MATLKTTIILNSSTLFPVPVNMTIPVTETIGGDHTGFQTAIIGANATDVNLYASTGAAGASGITYFYAQASADNNDTLVIKITRAGDGFIEVPFAILSPGDIMYVPLAVDDASATIIKVDNSSNSADATLYYFYGEKG